MQGVAAANRERKIPHVFGAVTDPYGAGVGITGPAPDQHPAHLVGVGTFQPVESAIRIAKQMNPDLKRLGVVWNPSEDNSEACVRKARATCAELGIAVAGGHTEFNDRYDRPVLMGAMIGMADRVLSARDIRPGDRLLATKHLAIEGLSILAQDRPDHDALQQHAKERHRQDG